MHTHAESLQQSPAVSKIPALADLTLFGGALLGCVARSLPTNLSVHQAES